VRRLPLALLLALLFLGAFTVMQHYSPVAYDAEAALSVAGDYGCTATMSVTVREDRCYRDDCYNVILHEFSADAEASISVTGACPPPSVVKYFVTAHPSEPMDFYVYLCRGAANATRLVASTGARRGLLREWPVGAYVYAQMGRVVVTSEPAYWILRCENCPGYGFRFTCYRDGQWYDVWMLVGGRLHASGTAVRGSASVLYVFVRLDQPAREVVVEAGPAVGGAVVDPMSASSPVPEEGPDLSDVVALYPVAIRQEYEPTRDFGPGRKRYYLVLEAVAADGSVRHIEVPADLGRAVQRGPQLYYYVAWFAAMPTARCEYPPQCPCVTNVTTYWLIKDGLVGYSVVEPPPIAPRRGVTVLPVGRRALLFVLSWPDGSLYRQPSWGAYAITVRINGARPRLVG
jgi:hypothetical protein